MPIDLDNSATFKRLPTRVASNFKSSGNSVRPDIFANSWTSRYKIVVIYELNQSYLSSDSSF